MGHFNTLILAWPGFVLVWKNVTDIGEKPSHFYCLTSFLGLLEMKQGAFTGFCGQQEGPWLGLPDVRAARRSHLSMQVSLVCALVV